jgi:hypothetical protein
MNHEFFIKKLSVTGSEEINYLGKAHTFLYWLLENNTLLKTDDNFTPIWQKQLSATSTFRSVHEASTNQDIIIEGTIQETADTFNKLLLIKLDSLGNLLWLKKYDNNEPVSKTFIKAIPTDMYIISNGAYIFTVDENGTIINQKLLKDKPDRNFTIDGIEFYNTKIYILGFTYTTQRIGATIILSTSLVIESSFRHYIPISFSGSSGGRFISKLNNQLILSTNSGDKKVLISFDLSNNFSVISAIQFNKSIDIVQNCNFINTNSNSCYVFGHQRTNSVPEEFDFFVYKISAGLSIDWVKKIENLEVIGTNFIASDNYLFIVPENNSQKWDRKTVIKTDTEVTFDCIDPFTDTDTIQSLSATRENYTFYEENISFNVTSPSYAFNDLSLYDVIQTCPPVASSDTSTIISNPDEIVADGVSTSIITVQLKDYQGLNITTGGDTVVIITDNGTVSPTTDVGNGTYTATLTSSTILGTALISFTVNGVNATDTTEVIFQEVIVYIPQSPHLYLQAAGSMGSDGSLAGIHLRWLLKNDLIKHLPKGNLATTTANYNKPDDFVKLFRASYIPAPTTYNLNQPPMAVENRLAVWVYKVNNIKVYLYFRNRAKYNTVRATLNPLTQTTQFLAAYDNEILELESKNELFFSVVFGTNPGGSPVVETEVLSVEANTLTAEKAITARKTFIGLSALSDTRILTENGRSFRFRPSDCEVTNITLEFYSILENSIENGAGWTNLGNFSLSTTDNEVFSRLEPATDTINGQWPRYNDDAFVNIQNYKDKWNVINPVTQSKRQTNGSGLYYSK